MVLQSGPALGSAWRTWATKVSCAVCMMNAQFDTFSPMPRKDRNLTRERGVKMSTTVQVWIWSIELGERKFLGCVSFASWSEAASSRSFLVGPF